MVPSTILPLPVLTLSEILPPILSQPQRGTLYIIEWISISKAKGKWFAYSYHEIVGHTYMLEVAGMYGGDQHFPCHRTCQHAHARRRALTSILQTSIPKSFWQRNGAVATFRIPISPWF